MPNITIAIDGYSSCGKSTVAKGVAKKLGYLFIDSGAMYRAVTLYCLQNNIIFNNTFKESDIIHALDEIVLEYKKSALTSDFEIHLNGHNVEEDIRSMEVSSFVSPISAIKEVRDKIVALQKGFRSNSGIVMDGRDIGTNIFPDAEVKIFMTADPKVRAQRRLKEFISKGIKVTIEEVRTNLEQRDYEDTHREHNPLRKAKDAIVLDNTFLSLDQQLIFALDLANSKK